MGKLFYFVREALRGFLQAKLMTFVSIVTIAVSLAILGGAVAVVYNVQLLLKRQTQRMDIALYLTDQFSADTAGVRRLLDSLRRSAEFDSVALVDKQAAWERFVATYGSGMLGAVEQNPLPASIELSLSPRYRSRAGAQKVTAGLAALTGAEDVAFSREGFERLEKVRGYVVGGALVLVIVCILVLQFVVSNTVKLTIYARRDLVTTMRLVGATDAYITTPFILEGILQGAVGAAMSVAALWTLMAFARPFVAAQVPGVLFHALIAMGVVFGWLGSASAVRKFLV